MTPDGKFYCSRSLVTGLRLTALFKNSRLRPAHPPQQGEERHLDPLR